MKSFIVCFSALLAAMTISGAAAGPADTDWCQVKQNHCQGKPHIGCAPNGFVASGASTDVKLIPLTPAQIELLVAAHNKYRNELASGAYSANKNFPAAAELSEMSWDEDLAYLAGLHAAYGDMQHDQCRATAKYPYSGQNLFTSMTSVDSANAEKAINDGVKAWFDEILLANSTLVDSLQMKDVMVAGHFTVMVNDRNNRLGCAVSKYQTVRSGRTWYGMLLTCNYGYTNMLGQSVYKKGAAASKCTCGRSAKFGNLCLDKETTAAQ